MHPPPTDDELLGMVDTHVIALDPSWCQGRACLHPEVASAFGKLREDAASAGFDLRVASGYRSFSRQLEIWNAKARGERKVLDAEGHPIDIRQLGETERVFAILRWSALPGGSRHHWGTDADVYDAAATPAGYQLQLSVDETRGAGPYSALHTWLDQQIADDGAWGFFRPYCGSGCEVASEPWHLSHAPLASLCQRKFARGKLLAALDREPVELLAHIRDNFDAICARFVDVAPDVYPPAWRDG